ncbi:MAG TPA: VTT domain-containing protein [candidate division Zixibacteria bacterium]|nr:VTT domain-containing protein [candidate division Zixibacteria bacterium]
MIDRYLIDMLSDWRLWLLVIFLTTITLVTSVAKYRLGRSGIDVLKEHYPQVSDERWAMAGGYFERWGAFVVLFSFLPLLAWIIPPAAGAYGVKFRPFLAWAFVAKMVRYWLLILIVFGGVQLIF